MFSPKTWVVTALQWNYMHNCWLMDTHRANEAIVRKLGNFSTNLIQKNTNKFVTIDMCIMCDPGMNIM